MKQLLCDATSIKNTDFGMRLLIRQKDFELAFLQSSWEIHPFSSLPSSPKLKHRFFFASTKYILDYKKFHQISVDFANSIQLMAQAQKWALRSKIVIPTFKIYFGSDMHLLQYCAIVIREKISFLHFFSFGISFFFRPYLRCLTLSLVHIYISKSHKLSHSLPVLSDILW